VLGQFNSFLHKYGEFDSIWGNGAAFDCEILQSLYGTFNMNVPWSFRQAQCYRTLKTQFGYEVPYTRVGTFHNAEDDARTQALHFCGIMRLLRSRTQDVR
jgi:hypothetical protein